MKKLLSLSLAAAAIAAVADYQPIQVGVTKITATGNETIIPVPYTTIGSSTDVSVHDLVKAANLMDGTKLYYYNGSSYQVWVKQDNAWTTPDVSATPAIAGTSVMQGSSEVSVAVGAALWVSMDFVNAKDAEKDIFVYGSPTAASWTIAPGKANLISNPTGSEIDGATLKNKLKAVSQKGDKIFPIGTGSYVYWAMAKDGTWSQVNGTSVTKNADLPTLGAYQGLWYVSKTSSGKVEL